MLAPDFASQTVGVVPTTKFVPVILTPDTKVPVRPVLGLIFVTVGAGLVTVKALANVIDCPSVLVTTTFHCPADVTEGTGSVSVQVMLVGETTVTDVAVILDDPDIVRFTVAPETKPVPAKFVIDTVFPATPVFGVIPVTVGAGFVTVNAALSVPDCPSAFFTTTSHSPADVVDGAGSGSVQVIWDDETTVTAVAVILLAPDFASQTIGVVPTTKFVPAILTPDTRVPATPLLGVIPVTVGGFNLGMCPVPAAYFRS